MRLGMMKAGSELALLRPSMTAPKGCSSTISNVLSSLAVISLAAAIMRKPVRSRCAQRLIDATQSAAVTGLPSWNFSPSRKVKR
ncbi:Uncharacterised protein [Bordetella pertussis]|nr:Uncharacterised protein [Bordetella pertussis]CPM84835.1 Uncharacterised protein [Bordetella pertussis]